MSKKVQKGFTLVELVVVVLIIAVIAAIAIPSFTAYVRKARRTEATSIMGDVGLRQERYRTNNPSYADTWTKLGMTAPTSTFYTFALGAATATSYSITATAVGPQSSDKVEGQSCSTLTLTRNGSQDLKTPSVCFAR